MANQNIQQEQIKEIFELNNLTRVEMTQNRKILRQLDVKLMSLNHSVYSLQAEIGTLNSAYNKVTFNEKLAITKENLCTKYTHSPINTSPLMKSCL